MKKINLFLFFFCALINVKAQPNFNKKELFQFGKNIFSNLIVKGDKLYVSGFVRRAEVPHTASGGFGVLTLSGDSISSKSYLDTLGNPSWWEKSMIETYNNNFLIAANLGGRSLLFKIDSTGKVLNSRVFYSYFYPKESWIDILDNYQDSDSLIWIITGVYKNSSEKYIQINKFNQNLDSLTKIVVGDSKYVHLRAFLTKLSDNRYLIAGNYIHDGFSNLRPGDFFIEVDKNGTVLSQFYVSHTLMFGGMGDMLFELSDSSYIMAGYDCYELKFDIYGYLYLHPMVYKLDKNKNLVWKTLMGNGSYHIDNTMYKIRESNEQDGYVFAGDLWPPGKDSLGHQQVYGTFGKVDKNGDSLWLRKYRAFDSGEIWGHLYDIQPAPDGGYYLCGSTIGGPDSTYNYQGGWILKVDKNGCLTPNCENYNALPALPDLDIHYSIFPNPSQDIVYVFLEGAEGKNLEMRLCSMDGKTIKSIKQSEDANYILSVKDLIAGIYFLQFWQNGRLVKTEKVVKE